MKHAFLLFCLVAACLFPAACKAELSSGTPDRLVITGADGAAHVFHIDLALTPEEQAYGLMNRKSLASDYGMLFLWDSPEFRRFWMKDTLVPLDMLFIDEKGRIVTLHENAVPEDLTSIPSEAPVLGVLEVAGGTAARLGIKEGDTVHYKTFGNELAPQP